jgi:hypothetical protein
LDSDLAELYGVTVKALVLARKLSELEERYDEQFRVVFEAMRELMTASTPSPRRPIGFVPSE